MAKKQIEAEEMKTSRRSNLKAYADSKRKDKKNKIKIGKLSEFDAASLKAMRPTLHLPIDIISGGIPKGVIYEIWGDESAGKTTTIGKILENWKIMYGDDMPATLYVDAENTFNHKFFSRFRFLDEDDVIFMKDSIIENIWNRIEEMVAMDALDVVVIDSLSALQTIAEEEKSIDGSNMAQIPRKINTMIKKFYTLVEDHGITLIIVNSGYQDINAMSYGPPKTILKGGKALALGKSCSIKISKSFSKSASVIEKIDGIDIMTEVQTKYVAEKNKLGRPKAEAITFLNVNDKKNKTFEYAKDVMQLSIMYGFINQAGAWLSAIDSKGEVLYKCQGSDKMAAYIDMNPSFYVKLKLLCYSKIYRPYEFYYLFEDIKKALFRELTYLKASNTIDLHFMEDLSDKQKEVIQEVIDQKSDILSLKASDVLTSKVIMKAKYDLKNFYGKDYIKEIENRNENITDETYKEFIELCNNDLEELKEELMEFEIVKEFEEENFDETVEEI
jgi:recombination protein RecA